MTSTELLSCCGQRSHETPVVLPIIKGEVFALRRRFAVPFEEADPQRAGVIGCDQFRVLDPRARCGKRLETVPDPITDDVLARLAAVLA